jgi:acyl-CoA thioester hydrolase
MARIKLQLPEFFSFTCKIPVRISDINYGGHAGNDTIFSLVHEARVQFLRSLGWGELDFDGFGLIMADAAVEYKAELFYGELVQVSVKAGEFSRTGFELFYKLETLDPAGRILKTIALAKTGMACFDYRAGRITAFSEEARKKLEA